MKSFPLAGCVLTDKHGKVLLLHRNTPRLTQWELPGGKLEPGETPEQAAVRETREEIGVSARIIKHLGETEFDDNGRHWHYTWFKAEIISGQPAPREAKHDDVAYFDLLDPAISQAGLSINIDALIKAIKIHQVSL